MNGQHWIDALFRKRLEGRMFPVEEGEFEKVRALLHKRNATTTLIRAGRFSKWWFSVLIPMAGLLWWAMQEGAAGTDPRATQVAEVRTGTGANAMDEHAKTNSMFATEVKSDPPKDPQETAAAMSLVTPVYTLDHTTKVRDARAEMLAARNTRRPHSTTELSPSAPVVAHDPEQGKTNDQVDSAGGSLQDMGAGSRADQGSIPEQSDAGSGTTGNSRAASLLALGLESAQVDAFDHASSSGSENALAEQRAVDAITILEPRWPVPLLADARQPVRREIVPWKRFSAGALHVFGAPLAVRSRSSNGDRSGAEAGSLLGFEYRVRAKRFTWATGIHYGSYALKADQGITDIKLEFVEVPLLASVAWRRGRFGLSMQGGMSVDLLFNSSGSYPLEQIRTSAGFPDDVFRAVNCSWLLRPQATYHVDDHLSICAGPLWKAQLGEVAKEGALDGARISSSGVSVGITWRLERSTY